MRVPECDVRRDPRFSVENQYEDMVSRLQNGVTPEPVHDDNGRLVGWKLIGWKPPPPIILYSSDWWGMEL